MWFLQLYLLLGLGLVPVKILFVKVEGFDVVAPLNRNNFPNVGHDRVVPLGRNDFPNVVGNDDVVPSSRANFLSVVGDDDVVPSTIVKIAPQG